MTHFQLIQNLKYRLILAKTLNKQLLLLSHIQNVILTRILLFPFLFQLCVEKFEIIGEIIISSSSFITKEKIHFNSFEE